MTDYREQILPQSSLWKIGMGMRQRSKTLIQFIMREYKASRCASTYSLQVRIIHIMTRQSVAVTALPCSVLLFLFFQWLIEIIDIIIQDTKIHGNFMG